MLVVQQAQSSERSKSKSSDENKVQDGIEDEVDSDIGSNIQVANYGLNHGRRSEGDYEPGNLLNQIADVESLIDEDEDEDEDDEDDRGNLDVAAGHEGEDEDEDEGRDPSANGGFKKPDDPNIDDEPPPGGSGSQVQPPSESNSEGPLQIPTSSKQHRNTSGARHTEGKQKNNGVKNASPDMVVDLDERASNRVVLWMQEHHSEDLEDIEKIIGSDDVQVLAEACLDRLKLTFRDWQQLSARGERSNSGGGAAQSVSSKQASGLLRDQYVDDDGDDAASNQFGIEHIGKPTAQASPRTATANHAASMSSPSIDSKANKKRKKSTFNDIDDADDPSRPTKAAKTRDEGSLSTSVQGKSNSDEDVDASMKNNANVAHIGKKRTTTKNRDRLLGFDPPRLADGKTSVRK